MDLLQRFKAILPQYGLSCQKASFLTSDQPLRDVLVAVESLFLRKTHQEIIQEIIAKKETIQKDLLQLDFCPFENLTSVNWNYMLRSSYYYWERNGKRFPVKNVVPFFHFFLPSHLFHGEAFHWHTIAGNSFRAMFNYTGKCVVRIRGTRYVYGEAGIVIDPKEKHTDGIRLRTQVSTVVFDDMIIPLLKRQENFDEVMEYVYLLYHLASHDAWFHLVFAETVPELRVLIEQDPVMKDMLKVNYFAYDMYEMNYIRMMREIFSIACEANFTLYREILAVHRSIFNLVSSWHPVAREYIQFITEERMSKIVRFIPWAEKKRTYLSGLKSSKSGKGKIHPIYSGNNYLQFITHGRPGEGALVHDDEMNFTGIPYKLVTEHMLGLYSKVNLALM